MRILLDENIPRKLKHAFSGFVVSTVPEMGWSGTSNGKLLDQAEGIFDVLITFDKGIQYQQNFTDRTIIVITLIAYHNKVEYLLPLIPETLEELKNARPGQVINIMATP